MRAKHVIATFGITVRNVVLTCVQHVHNVFEQNLNLVQLNVPVNDTFCQVDRYGLQETLQSGRHRVLWMLVSPVNDGE